MTEENCDDLSFHLKLVRIFYCLLLRRRSNRYRVGFNLCPKLHLRDFFCFLLPLMDFLIKFKRKLNKEKRKFY
jgi:hypothetical protein